MSVLSFPAQADRSAQIIDDIMRVPEIEPLSADLKFTLQLAIEELTVNILNYAYPAEEEGTLKVLIGRTEHELTLTFIDHGTPFNPLGHPDPDITLAAEEREIGGLGILLVKKLMDKVEYEYAEGENRMTIVKKL